MKKEITLTVKEVVKVNGSRRVYFLDSHKFYETRPTALICSLKPGDRLIFNQSKKTLKRAT